MCLVGHGKKNLSLKTLPTLQEFKSFAIFESDSTRFQGFTATDPEIEQDDLSAKNSLLTLRKRAKEEEENCNVMTSARFRKKN